MLYVWSQTVLLFGCVASLIVTSTVNADGRVFVLDLGNSSGLQGYRDAEQACASRHARLASAQELHHAVVECFFSPCTRGWLYGGTIGTTVCNVVGGALKAMDVRTENATEDSAHLDAFCVKDKGAPCGNPPSFPNARLQGHTGFQIGDELLYTCAPGHVTLSGHSAFSLLCDSCGEWYGLVHICVKDDTEHHVDYEDKFTDSFGETEHNDKDDNPGEAHGEIYEEVPGGVNFEAKRIQEQQEASLVVKVGGVHEDHQEEKKVERLGIYVNEDEESEQDRKLEGREQDTDFTDHSEWEQKRMDLVRTDAAVVTDSPVSLISQKHIFWLPSETFQEEGHPVSTNPVTKTTQRSSGSQSGESKERDSQEKQHPVDPERDSNEARDQDDHDDSRHDGRDIHHDNQDDHDSYDRHEDEDNHDDDVKHHLPAQHGDLDRHGQLEHHDDRDDHYDMGEHEDDRDHVWYTSQREYDDKSYKDGDNTTNDHGDDDQEHPDGSEEHPDRHDHDDGVEDYLLGEGVDNDHYIDPDLYEHDHRNHDRFDNHDDHHSHEEGLYHVIFSMSANEHHNGSHKGGKEEAPTDDSWLDGYAIVPDGREKGSSTVEGVRPDKTKKGTVISTERPKEVLRPIPSTSRSKLPEFPTAKSELEQWATEEVWLDFITTAAPSSDSSDPLDILDYDTQQAAPTHSWLVDLTEHPLLNQGPAPPVQNNNIIAGTGSMEEHNEHHPTDQKDNVEGEKGEAICTGDNCPPRPPSSSRQGSMAAIIIVAVSVVATAVIVGVWCYQRQQRKSSMYEMNGKDQGQTRHAQQIEMHQKV